MVKNNSVGEIWVVGGFVYRNIIRSLYNITTVREPDIYFMVEELQEKIKLPKNWQITSTGLGSPKLIRNDGLIVDICPLSNMEYAIRKKLQPTMELYLMNTPLNIQSIAFNMNKNCIMGDIGIKAILERKVIVNNMEEAQALILRRKRFPSVNAFVRDKAEQIGFEAVLNL